MVGSPFDAWRVGWRLLACVIAPVCTWHVATAQSVEQAAIPSLYRDAATFTSALAKEGDEEVAASPITGLILPHHLLAADLIVRGLRTASHHAYRRIIILSPDHFNRSHKPFATTRRDFETVFGKVGVDEDSVSKLLLAQDLFDDSELFEREHGIAALLPFIEDLFPTAKIVPIAIAVTSTREDWDRAFDALEPLLGSETLVIQSTDFSHYLRPEIARQRDQESLNVLATADPIAVLPLLQPDHTDSKAAFYLQLRLQAALGSHPVVIANRNSDSYVPGAERTTSYIVAAFSVEPARLSASSDQVIVYFGGDFFAGRLLAAPLSHPQHQDEVTRQVLAITGGAPLILNLEGAILDEVPPNLPTDLHAMDATLALPLLHALHVSAASLANNHSFDLGSQGLTSSIKRLEGSAIRPLVEGKLVDLGPFRIMSLNYVGKGGGRLGYPAATPEDIDGLCRSQAKPPIVAFVHWGREFTTTEEAAERSEAGTLVACGVSAVIGAHSHTASLAIEAPQGGQLMSVYSLGNLLFDQHSPHGRSALLELRFFRQGTFASRLIPLPNFFDQLTSVPEH